jgi:hypothetical protein
VRTYVMRRGEQAGELPTFFTAGPVGRGRQASRESNINTAPGDALLQGRGTRRRIGHRLSRPSNWCCAGELI